MFVFVQGAKHRLGFVAAESRAFSKCTSKARPGRGVVTGAAQGDNGIKNILPAYWCRAERLSFPHGERTGLTVRHYVASAPTFAPRPSYLTRFPFRFGKAC